EPPRDASGYRRYGAEHAVALVRIRTLAEAGVPLARVKELLAADPDRFAAAVAEIDRALAERVEQVQRTRERLAQLGAGDRAFVPAEVADYLDRLRGLGASARAVRQERDGWILLRSAAPEVVGRWIAEKRVAIEDPEFQSLYLACDAAFDWSPDDPRLPALAERVARWTADSRPGGQAEPVQVPPIARLILTSVSASSPAWDRLTALVRQRSGRPGAAG
ncbi:MAG TPA: MerR family transcriptional regulator, partial [Thermomicrobiaceae bacterium]|nr:MerR family transcriptional regulator [Thermomicrobiaceae bacterium]